MTVGSGGGIGEAYIRIRPTSTGFEAEVVKQVTPALKAVEKQTTINPKLNPKGVTGPLDLLKGKLAGFAGSNPLTSALQDVEAAAGGSGGALSGLAAGPVAIAGAAITAFALKGVADFQHLAGEVRNFQRVTGASAEESSRFVAAFHAIGTDVGSATQSLGRFSKNLTTNTAGLAGMGVQIARTDKGAIDVTETFLNVADAIHNSSDSAAKNTLALTALGRGGLALLPILSKGREGIQELFGEADKRHALLSQDDLDKAKALSLATIQLKEEFTGLEREAGQALIPFLTGVAHATTTTLEWADALANAVTKVASLGGLTDKLGDSLVGGDKARKDPNSFINTFREVVDQVVHGSKYVAEHYSDAALSGADATKELGDSAGGTAEDELALAQATEQANSQITNQAAAVDQLVNASLDVTSAQRAYTQAQGDVAKASERQKDAQAALNKILKDGAVDAKAVTSAQKGLDQAIKGAADAEWDLAEAGRAVETAHQRQIDAIGDLETAEQDLDDLRSGRTAAKDMKSHAHDLENANLRVRSATLSQHQAQTRLTEVQADATSTADDLAEAQLSLDQANLDLTEATEGVTATQEELTRIQNEGKEGSKELADAEQNVVDKQSALDTATQGLISSYRDQIGAATDLQTATDGIGVAQGALTLALAGDPEFLPKVALARRDLRDATNEVATAQQTASEKAYTLQTKIDKLNESVHGGLTDLQTAKSHLQAIIDMQPAAQAFLGPTIDQINQLISSTLAILGAATNINLKTVGGGQGFDRGKGQQAHATGGYATGSFLAGEQGPERVDLMAGGGAYVTPAHRTAVATGGRWGDVSVSVPVTFNGPVTDPGAVTEAMEAVANGAVVRALETVLGRARAGRSR